LVDGWRKYITGFRGSEHLEKDVFLDLATRKNVNGMKYIKMRNIFLKENPQ